MLLKQELKSDEKGNYRLRNTCSILPTLEEVKKTNELNPGGRFGDKNSEFMVQGYIPPEFWNWNIYLVASKEASMKGDPASAQEYLLKFFENYPMFKVQRTQKYWAGSRVVEL